MVDEEKNFRVLAKFVRAAALKTDDYGNIRFKAWVDYNISKAHSGEELYVRLIRNGYQDGDIEIEPGDEITHKTHHLGHSARLQSYSIRRGSNALVISGTSVRGRYRIEVRSV